MFTRTFVSSFLGLSLAVAAVGCTNSSTGNGGDANGGPNGGATNAPANHFFLPTGDPDNTSAPSVEVDADGGIHSIYPAYAGGGAYYAYCPANCSDESAVKVVRFETDGTVANAMLALDAGGHPQVLLAAYADVYYASCNGDCSEPGSWTTTSIVKHDGKKAVTGEAFALDADGRPRFLMHGYVGLFDIGSADPETDWVACDADCDRAASWKVTKIADQTWQSSTLRFDASGRAHMATVAAVKDETKGSVNIAAYQVCEADCTKEASWVGSSLAPAFTSLYDVVDINPTISMALTKNGEPRILVLAADDEGKRRLVYAECDSDCAKDESWRATLVSDSEEVGPGVDIALDANDRPRIVYTFDYNIAIGACEDAATCTDGENAKWKFSWVEAGSDMKPDEIFLWENCNVGAWFLHSPSIALTKEGLPRVGYQARDISGGSTKYGECRAGTDMTWSRMAVLSGI